MGQVCAFHAAGNCDRKKCPFSHNMSQTITTTDVSVVSKKPKQEYSDPNIHAPIVPTLQPPALVQHTNRPRPTQKQEYSESNYVKNHAPIVPTSQPPSFVQKTNRQRPTQKQTQNQSARNRQDYGDNITLPPPGKRGNLLRMVHLFVIVVVAE